MALHRFAHNTLYATIAGVSTAFGSLVGSIIVARLLGPAGAGAVALALWIAGSSVTFGDLGLPLTVSRFLPDLYARDCDRDAEALGRSFFFPILLTTLLGCGLAFVLFVLHDSVEADHPDLLPFGELDRSVWLAVGAVFLTQAIGNFGMSLLRGEQRFRRAALLAVASLVLQVVSIALGSHWFGIPGALFGYAAASILPGFVAFRRSAMAKGHRLDPDVKRRAWRFARHSWGVGLISTIVWSRTELAFLNYWRGVEETGYYAVAITLTLIASQLPTLATGGLLPLFTERVSKGDHEGLQRAYAKAMRFMALALFPACFGMAAVAPALLPLFFGPHFVKATHVTTLLVSTQGFGALAAVSSSLLFAAERGRFLVRIGFVGAAALLLAGVTVIPIFGLMGTAAARTLIQMGLAAAAIVYIAHRLKCELPLRSLFLILIAAFACAGAARLIVLEAPTPIGLALAIVTGVIVYAVCLRLLKVLPEEDLAQIASLLERLPNNLSRLLLPFLAFFDTSPKPARFGNEQKR